MSAKMDQPKTAASSRWRERAGFAVGRTHRQRRAQLRRQASWAAIILGAAVVAAGVLVSVNWQNAGEAKSLTCADFPAYCVPLAGGAPDGATLEAASTRQLDAPSEGAAGVFRGVADDGAMVIGSPDAPIEFRVVSSFACSHCNTYHTGDIHQFLQDYVLTGQARLSMVALTGMGGAPTTDASQAALCAGEQGAYWEFTDELYRLARTQGVDNGFTLAQIKSSAGNMGLDAAALMTCVTSDRYSGLLNGYQTFARDNGVSVTPTVLMRRAGEGTWTRLDSAARTYSNLAALTQAANTP